MSPYYLAHTLATGYVRRKDIRSVPAGGIPLAIAMAAVSTIMAAPPMVIVPSIVAASRKRSRQNQYCQDLL
jgi:hypothetical protein